MLIFHSAIFFKTFHNLLQKHAPIKKVSNKDKKTMKKTWITKGILKSIEKRTKFTENVLGQKMLHKKRNCTTFLSPIGILLIN